MSLIIDKITNKVATQNTVEALVDVIKSQGGGGSLTRINITKGIANNELYEAWTTNTLNNHYYEVGGAEPGLFTPVKWNTAAFGEMGLVLVNHHDNYTSVIEVDFDPDYTPDHVPMIVGEKRLAYTSDIPSNIPSITTIYLGEFYALGGESLTQQALNDILTATFVGTSDEFIQFYFTLHGVESAGCYTLPIQKASLQFAFADSLSSEAQSFTFGLSVLASSPVDPGTGDAVKPQALSISGQAEKTEVSEEYPHGWRVGASDISMGEIASSPTQTIYGTYNSGSKQIEISVTPNIDKKVNIQLDGNICELVNFDPNSYGGYTIYNGEVTQVVYSNSEGGA